ncbi:MAG: hypothetical protein KME05_20475 [Gloeocapsa sp. UFS-A4-WI-NPMV-4B04]|nr:hypothetical protein [Gloeocapsa sp. UFS-A4-WI-NPMV-4B04]
MSQENFTPTHRSVLKRLPKRGQYDRSTVYQILDEGLVCHVSFVARACHQLGKLELAIHQIS